MKCQSLYCFPAPEGRQLLATKWCFPYSPLGLPTSSPSHNKLDALHRPLCFRLVILRKHLKSYFCEAEKNSKKTPKQLWGKRNCSNKEMEPMENGSEVSILEGFIHALWPMKVILIRSGLVLEYTSFLVIKTPAGAPLFTCQNIEELHVLHYLFPAASISSCLPILPGKLPAFRQTALSIA